MFSSDCVNVGNSDSIFNWMRAVRNAQPSSSRSTNGSATSVLARSRRPATFGNSCANSAPMSRR